MTAGRERNSYRLPADLVRQLADHAKARRTSRTAIVEAALASYLSPDGADRLEAAVSRRLDRLTRQLDRLEWHVELGNETLAQFIRVWLINNPPRPDSDQKAAKAQANERWEHFVRSLDRKMELGPRFRDEIAEDKLA